MSNKSIIPSSSFSHLFYNTHHFHPPTTPPPSTSNQIELPDTTDNDQLTTAWEDALKAWESIRDLPPTHKSRKAAVSAFRNLVPKGIPPELRAVAWQKLLSADKLEKLGLLDALLSRPELPIYEQIDKDIGRTYPNHVLFKDPSSLGQKQLSEVLKAYAQYNPEVGYTQGMNFITGLLLLHMPPDESLCTLIALMTTHKFPHHSKDLSHLHLACQLMDLVTLKYLPKVAKFLQVNSVSSVMYLPRWWMSGFEILPWGCRVRAFDCIVVDGFTGFCRVSVAILGCIKDHLFTTHTSELLDTLLHPMPRDLIPDQFTKQYLILDSLTTAYISKLHLKLVKDSGLPMSQHESMLPDVSMSNSLSSCLDLSLLADEIQRGKSLPILVDSAKNNSADGSLLARTQSSPGLVARWLSTWSSGSPSPHDNSD